MSKKIDANLSQELVDQNMKRFREEAEKLRLIEDANRREANKAIDAGKRFDEDGLAPNERGEMVGVWEAARSKSDTILNAGSFKAYDDYRSAMMSLVGLYIDLNAALFYSAGEFMPGFMKAFSKAYQEFKADHPYFQAATEIPGQLYDAGSKWAGSHWHEFKKDFTKWVVDNKALPFYSDLVSQETERKWLADDLNDVQRSLIVEDLIGIVDYNPNAGKDRQFHGPITGLPFSPENAEKVNEFKETFNESMKFWLAQHGYTQQTDDNKTAYKNDKGEVLTREAFEKLRYHPSNGLKAHLSEYFAEDLRPHNSPGM